MTDLREDQLHELNSDAKVESDPGKEAQEVKSRMDDDVSPIFGSVPDATGYSGIQD